MNIQPIKRSINFNEYVDWKNNNYETNVRYQDFIDDMVGRGHSVEKCKEMWLNNFGHIPPNEPDRIYQCNILDSDVKVVVTVLRRNNILAGQKKFEVVKLNHLFLDTYDYKRILSTDQGKTVFKIVHEDLTLSNAKTIEDLDLQSLNEPYIYVEHFKGSKGTAINYEDSGWFTNLAINDLLSRMRLVVTEYDLSKGSKGRPTLFINDMSFIESTEFEFVDKAFEKKLYEYIENKFLNIESELK